MLLNNFEPETKSHDRIDVQRELTFSPLSMECHLYTKIAPTGVFFFLILKITLISLVNIKLMIKKNEI